MWVSRYLISLQKIAIIMYTYVEKTMFERDTSGLCNNTKLLANFISMLIDSWQFLNRYRGSLAVTLSVIQMNLYRNWRRRLGSSSRQVPVEPAWTLYHTKSTTYDEILTLSICATRAQMLRPPAKELISAAEAEFVSSLPLFSSSLCVMHPCLIVGFLITSKHWAFRQHVSKSEHAL